MCNDFELHVLSRTSVDSDTNLKINEQYSVSDQVNELNRIVQQEQKLVQNQDIQSPFANCELQVKLGSERTDLNPNESGSQIEQYQVQTIPLTPAMSNRLPCYKSMMN